MDTQTQETKEVIAPAVVPASTPIKFGLNQIGNATPQWINRTKRALNFFFAGLIIFLPSLAALFHTTVDNLADIIGIIMLGVNTIGIMFGVEPDAPMQLKAIGDDRPPVKPPTP